MTWPVDRVPDSPLQQGIYLERSVPPPPAWRVLFLNVKPASAPAAARVALASIADMLRDLQAGVMRDLYSLSNDSSVGRVPENTFAYLFGYGARFFDERHHDPLLTAQDRPAHLMYLRRTGSAFPKIPWSSAAGQDATSRGESDVLIQFTGVSDHAVGRAAVEVSNLIDDETLPVEIVGTHDGFLRDDGRSWIGFHDGVNNLEPSERRTAVECSGDPNWNRGGTYLALLRLEIALREWRSLTREEQESIVGRDKLTGWPLGSISIEEGQLRPKPAGHSAVTDLTDWAQRDAFFNPPDTGDRILEASHTHRTNQNKAAAGTPAAHRIFRQGYEFLEDVGPMGPRLGLNFLSFQSDLRHVQQILGLDGWLGDVNFGGLVEPGGVGPPAIALATLRAGGFYVVPPHETPFPGSILLSS